MFRNVCKLVPSSVNANGSGRLNHSAAFALEPQAIHHMNCAEAVGKVVNIQHFGKEKQYLRWNIFTNTITTKEGIKQDLGYNVLFFTPWLIEQVQNVPQNTTVVVEGQLRYNDRPSQDTGSNYRSVELIADKVTILGKPRFTSNNNDKRTSYSRERQEDF